MVPIGCVITVGFLTSGLKSFSDGNAVRSQKMMRGRVLAQGVTVAVMMGYAAYNAGYLVKNETENERDTRILDPTRTTKR